ncbi:MAG: fibronectin type III domain-containing protein [Chthoniobacterales bacterium]
MPTGATPTPTPTPTPVPTPTPSPTPTATPTPTPVPPNAPTNLIANASSSSQVNLGWMDNSTNETGFRIERCNGAGCTNFRQIAIVSANVSSYANTSLRRNTSYSYRVRSYNLAGSSAYSNTATATTPRK